VRLLVTGGSGFLGRRVIPLARQIGHEVAALARSQEAAAVVVSFGATPVVGDLDDATSTEAAFVDAKADALVNLASLGFGHAPVIVRAAEVARLDRAVFVSTTAVTTRLNATSKTVRLAAEACIKVSGLRWTIVRPTMIYGGPDDRNLARLLQLLRRSPIVPLPGGGRRLQQPVHVEDLAAAILAAVQTDAAIGKTYDLAGPAPLSFRQLVGESAAAVGKHPLLVPLPLAPLVGAARAYERVARRPRVKAEQLERLAEDKSFAIDDAAVDLGFAPRSFADGIRAEAAAL
jgi:uncharacterized protein YbjT (DUF2867 family)